MENMDRSLLKRGVNPRKRKPKKPLHTQGPWRVEHEKSEWINGDEIPINGGETGTQVVAAVWPVGDDDFGMAEQMANAKLVAAVPELLALKNEVGELLNLNSSTDLVSDLLGRVRAAYDAAHAAIS